MSATSSKSKPRGSRRGGRGARPDPRLDPRVARTRTAVVESARALFLDKGLAGTTMDEIAASAGLTKRTLYNNYADKATLFTEIVADVIAKAESFAEAIPKAFPTGLTADELPRALHEFAHQLAVGILRPEVIALRRLLIREAATFPALATEYFQRAPGRVLDALTIEVADLHRRRVLRAPDASRAAIQFAYLVVGHLLDEAMLVGAVPSRARIVDAAREGVATFLARYAPTGTTNPRGR